SKRTSTFSAFSSRLVTIAEIVTSSRSVKNRGASSRTINGFWVRATAWPTPSCGPVVSATAVARHEVSESENVAFSTAGAVAEGNQPALDAKSLRTFTGAIGAAAFIAGGGA